MAVNHGVRPLDDNDREQVRELHAQGLGRNEIARRIGRAPRSVTVICNELGLTFDRSGTEVATKARAADLAEKRALLAEALTDDALRLTDAMWQPSSVYAFGGRDNVYREKTLPEPPADAKKALMTAAGQAIDRSLRLVPLADDPGITAARSMLGALAEGISRLAKEGEGDPGEG